MTPRSNSSHFILYNIVNKQLSNRKYPNSITSYFPGLVPSRWIQLLTSVAVHIYLVVIIIVACVSTVAYKRPPLLLMILLMNYPFLDTDGGGHHHWQKKGNSSV